MLPELNIDKLLADAVMMRQYKEVIKKNGPTQALIDFINHGKDFGADIGLESFSNFSTQAQHEIMLSKMDPDMMEEAAIESLYASLDLFAKLLTGSGIISIYALQAFLHDKGSKSSVIKISIASAAALAGCTIGFLNDKLHKVVIPYKLIDKIKEGSKIALVSDKLFYSKVPVDFKLESWKNFYDATMNPDSKFAEDYEKWMVKYLIDIDYDRRVPLKESGWTPEKVGDWLKWYGTITTELAHSADGMAPKFKKIKEWYIANKSNTDPEIRETAKYIKRTLKYAEYTHMSSYEILDNVKKITKILLNRVQIEKQ
jgi:hypothetical protein